MLYDTDVFRVVLPKSMESRSEKRLSYVHWYFNNKEVYATEKKLSYTQNRELSWLQFNARVLDEAADPAVPLLERLKFWEIFARNLDEFFTVRVGSLFDLAQIHPTHIDAKSAMTPKEQLDAIYHTVRPLYRKRDQCFLELIRQFAVHDIHYLTYPQMQSQEIKYVKHYFKQSIKPILSPQIIDAHHPFPNLQNNTLHLVARLTYRGTETFACVPIPQALPDVLFLPGHDIRLIPTTEVVQAYFEQLFPGYSCIEQTQLRLTRNADITTDHDASDLIGDFREQMQMMLHKRKRLAPVRLELSGRISPELESYLCLKFSLEPQQIYITKAPMCLNLSCELDTKLTDARKSILSYPPFTPQIPMLLVGQKHMQKQIQDHDLLLSYPYESISPFLLLLKEAAHDPTVISIKITIYRLASKAKLVEHLCAAAENGKEVIVLIELRARFDEQNNIDWSERLEEAGCTILYGFQDYKVHSKICLITRRDHNKIRYITQIGTGNYNEKTAASYTDLSIFTADQAIGHDADVFFKNMMIGNLNGSYAHLLVAPVSLKPAILSLIDREISKGVNGKIVLKLNAVTDLCLIRKLRDASCAGVSITLIVRGICCILPQVPGETENIRIRSIVGRYLEHSRIYCFGEGSDEALYISSADFMTRNTMRRVEVACPIYDPQIKERIHNILDLCLRDNVRARELQPNGTYLPCSTREPSIDCQEHLMSEAIHTSISLKRKKSFRQVMKEFFR